MKPLKNRIGETFGYWTILEQIPHPTKLTYKCQCRCGNVRNVSYTNLHDGNSKSCGCYKVEQQSLEAGWAAANSVYAGYLSGAKKRGLEFSLTREQWDAMTQLNCFYCGSEPSNIATHRYHGAFVYNGIDRLDPNKGYIEGNVVPCCFECNRAKNDMSYSQFLDWIGRLTDHQFSNKLRVIK